jgi:hypothetical protein
MKKKHFLSSFTFEFPTGSRRVLMDPLAAVVSPFRHPENKYLGDYWELFDRETIKKLLSHLKSFVAVGIVVQLQLNVSVALTT